MSSLSGKCCGRCERRLTTDELVFFVGTNPSPRCYREVFCLPCAYAHDPVNTRRLLSGRPDARRPT